MVFSELGQGEGANGGRPVAFYGYITLAVIIAGLHILPCNVYASHGGRGEDVPLYYDVRTGNLTMDVTNVDSFGSYVFEIPFEGYIPENFTPFTGSFFATARSTQIGETNLAGVTPGVYSIGNVLPAGLTPDELMTYFEPIIPYTIPYRYQPYLHHASGIGTGTYYVFEPFYSPSPFPPLNDPTVGPPVIDNWAEMARLTYNAATGDLILDTTGENGGTLWSYWLYFNEDIVAVDSFSAITELAPLAESRAISEISVNGIPEGVYDLGPVLPEGLSEAAFFDSIDRARFIGEPGHGAGALDLDVSGIDIALAYIVPEPSGALLGLVAMPFLLLRRRTASS